MLEIFKYSFFDMIRNRWMFIYTGFFMLLCMAFLMLSNNLPQVIISLTNVVLVLTPLIGILFGCMYFYSSREFVELLLAQPISRRAVFSGMYLGLALSLCVSLIIGIGLPMLFYGILSSPELEAFLILLATASILSIVFSLLAFLIAMRHENKIRGFGIAIFTWLFFAIIYDGIFLLLLLLFKEYPLEKMTIGIILFNPIDLVRILILLKLDMSAMMGYTGAVLHKFFGSAMGSLLIMTALSFWVLLPAALVARLSRRKDF